MFSSSLFKNLDFRFEYLLLSSYQFVVFLKIWVTCCVVISLINSNLFDILIFYILVRYFADCFEQLLLLIVKLECVISVLERKNSAHLTVCSLFWSDIKKFCLLFEHLNPSYNSNTDFVFLLTLLICIFSSKLIFLNLILVFVAILYCIELIKLLLKCRACCSSYKICNYTIYRTS